MKKFFALSLVCAFLGSCAPQKHSASNLSFIDVSLNYDSEDFDIVELQSVKRSASSLFGISSNDQSSAELDRSTYTVGNATSLGTASLFTGAATIWVSVASADLDEAAAPVWLISTALWAAYNDLVWSNTVKNKAIQRCNYSLIERYPDIDAFINPKYEISWTRGFASTTCQVTLTAQGVILKNKLPYNQSNGEQQEIDDEDRNVDSVDEKSIGGLEVRNVSRAYASSIGNLNYLANLIKQIAPQASAISDLSNKDLKNVKRLIKRYESNYKRVKDFQDYQSTDLLFSEEQFESYWNEYLMHN